MSLPEKYKALLAHGKEKEPTLGELPLKKPGKNQVLVKMEFAPINPSDEMTAQGEYPVGQSPPHPFGLEGSGTVAALGEDLKVSHNIGDKVHVTGLGTFGQYLLTDSEQCTKVSGNLSLEAASCHFVNPTTVHYMAHILKTGNHKAAIHTVGTSSLGRMLIRYFKHKGLKLISIVRREEAIEELKKEGAEYVLNSKAPDFEEKLKELAHKEEATVCFEPLCGEFTNKVFTNMPDNSTLYIYGALIGGALEKISAPDFIFKGKTITGLWLSNYVKELGKSGKIVEVRQEVLSLLPTVLSTNIQGVYKLEEFKKALEEKSSSGKMLIKPN